jgi:hypothetical protein
MILYADWSINRGIPFFAVLEDFLFPELSRSEILAGKSLVGLAFQIK